MPRTRNYELEGPENNCILCAAHGECLEVPYPERVWDGKCAYLGMNAHMPGFLSHVSIDGENEEGEIIDYWGRCQRNPSGQHAGARNRDGAICETCGVREFVPPPKEQIELGGMPPRFHFH